MLKHLAIKNYALIKHLEFDPSPHLNVVTGETGAGKSIMLGALGLLLGNRADTKVLWDENEKCITEGTFDISSYKLKSLFKAEDLDYDDLTVMRREISPGGKSRAFINDTPVTLDVLKKIGSLLMDIHSQHETLLLGNQAFQLKLIDTFSDNVKLRDEYSEAWQSYLKTKKAYDELSSQAETLRDEADYINFQLEELLKAELDDIDQDALESELKIMEHAEEIKSRFNQVLQLLNNGDLSSRTSLAEARLHLQHVESYSANYSTLHQRTQSLLIELDDIIREIESEEENIEFDPARAEVIKEKLSIVYRLLKKHKANDVAALRTLQEEVQRKANITSNLDEELLKSKSLLEQSTKELKGVATKLSDVRKKTFKPLCAQVIKLLKELGIPEATLDIEHQAIEPTSSGIDKVEILFSANKGISPRPLAQVASGGEFSRLMFCIKYVMAEKSAMPTLILDEIDNGVSGEIAIKLGRMMKSMAKDHQLICISHLPQVAAKGDSHYFVYKDNTAAKTMSNIRLLTAADRVQEIAKMIGGENPSKVAVQGAKELISSD
jgi:DNA repair protein RecN (Recombination protein N)